MDLDVTSASDLMGPWMDHLGMEYTELTGSRIAARWTASDKHHQPFGIVHGGVHCSVVETLASIGAHLWAGPEVRVVGVNNSTDFYRAVREGEMTSVGTPVHQGRSQQVWVVETHDADGRLVARGQVRIQNLRTD